MRTASEPHPRPTATRIRASPGSAPKEPGTIGASPRKKPLARNSLTVSNFFIGEIIPSNGRPDKWPVPFT